MAIRIDGRHPDDRLLMIGAVGIEVSGQEHPPGVVEGATENAATVQAPLGNLIERGLNPQGTQHHRPACAQAHAAVRRALKQAREPDDADKAERLMRNLARRFGQEAPNVSGSILEGSDETLTMVGLGLPLELHRSLAGTNIIASMNGGIRQVRRNVKRWRDARMALRWPATGMFEAGKDFRRIKACKQLPILKQALIKHRQKRQLDRIKGAA